MSLWWRIWRFLGADRIRQSLAGLAPEFKLLAHGFGQRAELDAFVRCKMPEIGEVSRFVARLVGERQGFLGGDFLQRLDLQTPVFG